MTLGEYIEGQVDYHKTDKQDDYSKGWNDAMDYVKRIMYAKFKNNLSEEQIFIIASKMGEYCLISPNGKPFLTPDGVEYIANRIFDTQILKKTIRI